MQSDLLKFAAIAVICVTSVYLAEIVFQDVESGDRAAVLDGISRCLPWAHPAVAS